MKYNKTRISGPYGPLKILAPAGGLFALLTTKARFARMIISKLTKPFICIAREMYITELFIPFHGYGPRFKKKVAHSGYPSPGPRPCCTQFYALSEANIVSFI